MAVRFDEVSDRYEDPRTGAGVPSGDFTFTSWVYMSVDRAALSCFWSFQTLDFANWYILGVNADRTITFFTNGHNLNAAMSAMTVGVWYKFAVTLSGTTGTLYAADESSALAQVSSGTVTTHIPQQLYVGGSSSTDQWFNGRLAAVKMWTKALSQSECATELAQFDPVVTSNLLRYYKLKVADVNDYSGNGWTLLNPGTVPATEDDPPIPDTLAAPVDNSLRGIICPDSKWL